MSVFETALDMKSFRSAKDQPVERKKVGKILEAARHTPSPGNVQSLEFIVVDEEHSRHLLSKAAGDQRVEEAPVSIIVVADVDRMARRIGEGAHEACIGEASAAAHAMRMVADDEGLGSCWLTGFDVDKVKADFEIPDGREVMGVVSLCYPESEVEPDHRFGMNETVFYERYDNQMASVFDGFEWEGLHENTEMASQKARGLYWKLKKRLADII